MVPSALSLATTHTALGRDVAEIFFRNQHIREYHESNRASASAIVRSVAWNALGTLIAASGSTLSGGLNIIRIWNPEKHDVKYSTELRGHSHAVESIAWDPSLADRLVSCSPADGSVRLWDVRSKQTLQILNLTANGTMSTSNGTTSTVNGATTAGRPSPSICPALIRYTPDGKWIIICGYRSRSLMIVSSESFTPSANSDSGVFEVNDDISNDVTCAVVSFSGTVLAVAFSSGIVKFYEFDTESGHVEPKAVWTMNAHRTGITCMEFDPRGTYLALGSNDSLVSIWNMQELACVRTFAKAAFPVKSLSFSFDGAYLAVSLEATEPVSIVS